MANQIIYGPDGSVYGTYDSATQTATSTTQTATPTTLATPLSPEIVDNTPSQSLDQTISEADTKALYPSNSKPKESDTTEGDGKNTPNPSGPWGPMNNPIPGKGYQWNGTPSNDKGGYQPPKEASFIALGDSAINYGYNNTAAGRPETSKTPNAKPVDRARDRKKEQGADPSHPFAGSQDASLNIHDALHVADPGSAGAILKKALQSMIMLKMMDKLTSPAGILSMASGGIGGALKGMAAGVGVGAMIGALNSVMPALSQSGLLDENGTQSLHEGMMGMLNNVAVGALAGAEVAAATATSYAIKSAMYEINRGSPYAVDAVAQFGGPAFGLTPGSLAAKIALIGPNGYVNTSDVYGGIRVNTTIYTSPNPHPTARIPVLNGAEHIAIATAAVSDIAGTVSNALGINSPLGQVLGGVSNVAGTVSDITAGVGLSAFPGIASGSFTHTAFAGCLNGGISNIVDGGLNKILGFPMSGLLSNVTSLLPNAGSLIQNGLSKVGNLVPDLGDALTGATKAMALSKVAFNTAKNIFEEARAESIANAVGATASLAATVGGPITHITAFGDRITSTPVVAAGTRILDAGTQVVIGNSTRII